MVVVELAQEVEQPLDQVVQVVELKVELLQLILQVEQETHLQLVLLKDFQVVPLLLLQEVQLSLAVVVVEQLQ